MADDPRSCALDIFQDVVRQRQPMDAALSSHAEIAHLPPAGQAFARRLVITTLKRLGQIDAVWIRVGKTRRSRQIDRSQSEKVASVRLRSVDS